MGIVNIVRTLSQSAGPTITGVLAGRDRFWIAFTVAGSIKATYDLGLLVFFAGRVHGREQKDDSDDNRDRAESERVSPDVQSIGSTEEGQAEDREASERDIS